MTLAADLLDKYVWQIYIIVNLSKLHVVTTKLNIFINMRFILLTLIFLTPLRVVLFLDNWRIRLFEGRALLFEGDRYCMS